MIPTPLVLENLFFVFWGVGIFFALLVLITIISALFRKSRERKRLKKIAGYVLLKISQTRHSNTQEQQMSDVERAQLFEELIASIVPQDQPIIFEMAVPNNQTEIQFFISTSPEYASIVKTQIRRVFERAQVEEVPDYTIFNENSNNILCSIGTKHFYGLPIRSYKKLEVDTFLSFVGSFANATELNTGMAMQVVLQKSNKSAKGEIKSTLKELKSGKKLKYIKPTSNTDRAMGTAIALMSSNKVKEPNEEEPISKEAELMEEKLNSHLYDVNIRIGVSAQTQQRADLLFNNIKELFSQLEANDHNEFVFEVRKDKKIIRDLAFRFVNPSTVSVLNAEEITSFFHIVDKPLEVENVQWMKTKQTAPPSEIAKTGLFLGNNIFHGKQTEVYMPDADRLRHTYIIGQTGTGKSAIITSMAYQDIQNGAGCCVIDPHGDLVDDMLGNIPENRIDDVVIIDPSNLEAPFSLNMLEYDKNKPEEKTFIVNELLSIFFNLFDQSTMGPMFEHYMRNSLILLMEGKVGDHATLAEVPRVLTDHEFRKELLANVTNVHIKRFWIDEAEKAGGDLGLENIAPYITSKFGNFITNDYIRPIISQPNSSISFRDIMDEGKLLFVRLPKGRIGEINMQLLGMLVIGKITLSAFSRENIPQEQRRPFHLYIDEFQNFTTDSIAKILSEARKYALSLTMANQNMDQLKENIQNSILGNVGTTISFRIGVKDAEIIEKKFNPYFVAAELTEIENLNCVVGMLSNSKPLDPFTMKISFAPRGSKEIKQKIIKYSSLKYSGKKI